MHIVKETYSSFPCSPVRFIGPVVFWCITGDTGMRMGWFISRGMGWVILQEWGGLFYGDKGG